MGDKNPDKDNNLYSRHIFCLPVQLDLGGDLRRSERYVERLCRKQEFRVGGMKLAVSWKQISNWEAGILQEQQALKKEQYMVWQYLSHQSRGIFADLDPDGKKVHSACRILRLELESAKDNTLTLVRAAEKKEEKVINYDPYVLSLKKLEYHIYSFGCGVLMLDTELTKESISEVQESADVWVKHVKWVADRGRRIRLPFIPDQPNGFILTAESMTLTVNGTAFTTSFREQAQEFLNGKSVSEMANPVLELFRELLSAGKIKPLLPADDRMFEIELLRYPENTLALREWREDRSMQELVYSVLHVDDGSASCTDPEMRMSILKKEVDPRWSEYGTLHGATNYSFVCMVNDNTDADASTVRPFLTEYPYMVSLALAQRACLAMYSEQAGNILRGTRLGKLFGLQNRFTRFQSTLLVPEFTDQEQGIELYRILKKAMLIDDEQEQLQKRLGERFEMVDTASELFLAVLAVILAVVIPLLQFFIH